MCAAVSAPRAIHAELLGRSFRFEAHPGLFAADRVDEGTRLLLEQLPSRAPASVLDLGCGYGALGLPVAAAHPEARLLLVDRDALAAEYSARNAASHGLGNVETRASLGYRDVGEEAFDWVLCNVPARIGEEAVAYLVGAGAARLTGEGELRVVVIRDLAPGVERLAQARGWPVRRVADGPRHAVFACGPLAWTADDHESLYARDRVRVDGVEYERPHDINEDVPHLREGVPLLLDCLPKSVAQAVTWRAGYGPVPLTLARRGAAVTATDRDLLALAYVRRNARALGLSVDVRPTAHPDAPGEAALFAGELYANVGAEGLAEELAASQRALGRNGQALWLGLAKVVKALSPAVNRLGGVQVATRGAFAVVRLPGPR